MEKEAADFDWNDFPEDLERNIFAWLPAEFVYRYRGVCQEWNAILSSKYFLTSIWAETPINKQPCLLLCSSSAEIPCLAFDFYKWTWKHCFSLGFLTEELGPRVGAVEVTCRSSAAGLLLVNFKILLQTYVHPDIRVCNPYTGTSIELAPMSLITTIIDKSIVVDGDGQPENIFKVVVLGQAGRAAGCLVELYDSSEMTWNIAGRLPPDLRFFEVQNFTVKRRMVYCDGAFYILGHLPQEPLGIVGFSMPSNVTRDAETPVPLLLAPFPEELLNDRLSSPRLVTCGSRLLVVAAMREGIRIWEFESDHRRAPIGSLPWTWKEIARVPESIWEDFKTIRLEESGRPQWEDFRINVLPSMHEGFDCIGVGDHLCLLPWWNCYIAKLESEVALVYNNNNNNNIHF